MIRLLYIISLLLIAVGFAGWSTSSFSKDAVTALIPAAIGSLMLICALFTKMSKPIGIHAALFVALLGVAGSFMPIKKNGFDLSQASVLSALSMTVLLLIFIGAGIRSFINARKAKKA